MRTNHRTNSFQKVVKWLCTTFQVSPYLTSSINKSYLFLTIKSKISITSQATWDICIFPWFHVRLRRCKKLQIYWCDVKYILCWFIRVTLRIVQTNFSFRFMFDTHEYILPYPQYHMFLCSFLFLKLFNLILFYF